LQEVFIRQFGILQFCIDSKHDIESEEIMKCWLMLVSTTFRAFSMATVSDVKIAATKGTLLVT